MKESTIMQLIETDPVERTVEWLRHSVHEHEHLLAKLSKLGTLSPDAKLESLRCALKTELDRNRKLLTDRE